MKKIAFIVYYPYQWFIYKNIYKALPQEKRMVVVDLGAQPELQNLGVKSSITKLLDKEGVAYSIIEKSDYRKPFFFKSFFSNIEVIVSCWEIGCVGVNDAKDIKKICTTYGIAKELTLLRPSRSIYDIILAYGDRDQNYFSLLTKSLAIGNPRLDNYYTNQIDINKKIKFKDPSKKKILYVPTHGDIGSSEVMFETLKSLTAEYNIIFKPHYYSLREEVDIVNKYRSLNSIQVLDDSWDVIELMTEVDIIVSDNSSAIFDAMQVNKPIIVCDFLELDFIDIIHKNLRLVKRGVVGATTYSGSLEQEIKNKDWVLTITEPSKLRSILENISEIDVKYEKIRKEIVKKHFKYIDGSSSVRAANIIMDTYNSRRDYHPGILHHAYLSYSGRKYRSLIAKKEDSSPSEEKISVWLVCESDSNPEEVVGTIYSALSQQDLYRLYVSGWTPPSSLKNELKDKVSFCSFGEVLVYIGKDSKDEELVLISKPNTKISHFDIMKGVKSLSGREIIFFAENIIFDLNNNFSKLFYLLKREILNLNLFSKETLTNVTFEQINVIPKSAILLNSKTIKANLKILLDSNSFEKVVTVFIMGDLLNYSKFLIMPDLLKNQEKSNYQKLIKNLTLKGVNFYQLGVPLNSWPDKKFIKYIIKILSGNPLYFLLIKFILVKIFFTYKYAFLVALHDFLSYINGSISKKNKDDLS